MMAQENTLATGKTGQSLFIVGTSATGKSLNRLESLGIIPGTEVEILANNAGTPLLVSVGESRVMVDRKIAEQVLVA